MHKYNLLGKKNSDYCYNFKTIKAHKGGKIKIINSQNKICFANIILN